MKKTLFSTQLLHARHHAQLISASLNGHSRKYKPPLHVCSSYKGAAFTFLKSVIFSDNSLEIRSQYDLTTV